MVHVDWTVQPDIMHIPIHIAMIKERLTRNLAPITPDVVDEVQRGFEELIPATEKGAPSVRFRLKKYAHRQHYRVATYRCFLDHDEDHSQR